MGKGWQQLQVGFRNVFHQAAKCVFASYFCLGIVRMFWVYISTISTFIKGVKKH